MNEINDLIRNCEDIEKRDLLIRLKELNKMAYNFMMKYYMSYKDKYHLLQKTIIWVEAKNLLLKYFDGVKCSVCGNSISEYYILHHIKYVKEEIFTPTYINIIHSYCHSKIHKNMNDNNGKISK